MEYKKGDRVRIKSRRILSDGADEAVLYGTICRRVERTPEEMAHTGWEIKFRPLDGYTVILDGGTEDIFFHTSEIADKLEYEVGDKIVIRITDDDEAIPVIIESKVWSDHVLAMTKEDKSNKLDKITRFYWVRNARRKLRTVVRSEQIIKKR